MRKVTISIYSFEELSEEAQNKAIEDLRDINTLGDWWEFIYQDTKNIFTAITGGKLRIINFDLDRGIIGLNHSHIDLKDLSNIINNKVWEKEFPKISEKINFGNIIKYYNDLPKRVQSLIQKGSIESSFSGYDTHFYLHGKHTSDLSNLDERIDFVTANTAYSLIAEFEKYTLSVLTSNYEYRTSEEAIKETIIANEYEFTADGELFS